MIDVIADKSYQSSKNSPKNSSGFCSSIWQIIQYGLAAALLAKF
jgi:hypothetical protein